MGLFKWPCREQKENHILELRTVLQGLNRCEMLYSSILGLIDGSANHSLCKQRGLSLDNQSPGHPCNTEIEIWKAETGDSLEFTGWLA